MGGGSSKHVEQRVQKADQIKEERDSGFHVVELHIDTIKASGAFLIAAIVAALAIWWAVRHLRRRGEKRAGERKQRARNRGLHGPGGEGPDSDVEAQLYHMLLLMQQQQPMLLQQQQLRGLAHDEGAQQFDARRFRNVTEEENERHRREHGRSGHRQSSNSPIP